MGEAKEKKEIPTVGISIGDPNGIGPEIIIKSLNDPRILNHFTPVIYASGKLLAFYKKQLDLNFNYHQAANLSKIHSRKINLINVWDEPIEITPGEGSLLGGSYAVRSLKQAVADLKEGKIDALTTAPIRKDLVQSEDFHYPGHTEYLANEAGTKDHLMFLVHENLRVGIVTGHIPISEVPQKISKQKIVSKLRAMIKSLQLDFGIAKPKIAVLGLNPHAGENGLLGEEEEKIIIPAINEMKGGHHIIYGPFSSDGFFGMRLHKKYDGILAMYHDQGLIPFKTIAFEEGVNFTANLPFIRTSPDHGTAFEIAGKGEADETSFRNALYLACDIAKKRMGN